MADVPYRGAVVLVALTPIELDMLQTIVMVAHSAANHATTSDIKRPGHTIASALCSDRLTIALDPANVIRTQLGSMRSVLEAAEQTIATDRSFMRKRRARGDDPTPTLASLRAAVLAVDARPVEPPKAQLNELGVQHVVSHGFRSIIQGGGPEALNRAVVPDPAQAEELRLLGRTMRERKL